MRKKLNSFILFVSSIVLPLSAGAQAAAATAAPAADKQDNYNMVLITMISFMVVLLFAIGAMVGVVRQLSIVLREKIRQEKREKRAAGMATKGLLLLFALGIAFQSFGADAGTTDKPAAPAGSPYISGILKDDFYLMMSVIALEIVVLIGLAMVVRTLVKALRKKPEAVAEGVVPAKKSSPFWDRFNKSVSIEREKDVQLDHDYDGIKELDNALPPWWIYGFYVTIIFACIYLYRFQIAHTGPSSQEEYAAEMQKAEEEKAAYLAKAVNNVDENSVTMLTDAPSLGEGQNIFQTTCSPCHGKDGGGIVGPNLTDDYWLHGGSIKDVFKSIKYGWQDKGMKSWKDDFSAHQIQELASYVKSLHGTHPAAPKDRQGELYIESSAPAKDTTKPNSNTTAKQASL